jgi:hypothetical protein
MFGWMGNTDQSRKDHHAIPEYAEDELIVVNGEPFQQLNPLGSLCKDELHGESSRGLRGRFMPRSAQCIRVVVNSGIAHGMDQ